MWSGSASAIPSGWALCDGGSGRPDLRGKFVIGASASGGYAVAATGGTAEAAAKLIEKSGGVVAGFIFVINLFDLPGKKLLEKKGYESFSIIDFPGH